MSPSVFMDRVVPENVRRRIATRGFQTASAGELGLGGGVGFTLYAWRNWIALNPRTAQNRTVKPTTRNSGPASINLPHGTASASVTPLRIESLIASSSLPAMIANNSGNSCTHATDSAPHLKNRACVAIGTPSLNFCWKIFWLLPRKNDIDRISVARLNTRNRITANNVRNTMPLEAWSTNCR